jgi:uncharacterized membrane protein
MTLASAVDFFTRDGGAFISRWAHVLFGITWIGLLYYFNFVQVPAFAQMEAAARNNAIDKLASRALWWFRWAAVATFLSGLLIYVFQVRNGTMVWADGEYMKTLPGISIVTGISLAIIMLLNVWGVIWRNQKIVIASARGVQEGKEPDPRAADAGRKALMASRQNAIFSLPMLLFMVGTSHFAYGTADPQGGTRAIYWGVVFVVTVLLELNALGVFGRKPGGTRVIYDTHKAAIITGLVLVVIYGGWFAYGLAI